MKCEADWSLFIYFYLKKIHLFFYSKVYCKGFSISVLLHLKKLFIFNWRIIALQYCVGFCHISTWISHRYRYVRSLLNLPHTPSHPSWWSQSPSLSSLSHITNPHWLSNFMYGNVYVSLLPSQFVCPTLSSCYVHKSAL